jgi:hypothetical protein
LPALLVELVRTGGLLVIVANVEDVITTGLEVDDTVVEVLVEVGMVLDAFVEVLVTGAGSDMASTQ